MRKAWLVLAVALVVSACSIACQAKDYKEQIGPYVIKFWLPDWIQPMVDKDTAPANNTSLNPLCDAYEYKLRNKTGLKEVDVEILYRCNGVCTDPDMICDAFRRGYAMGGRICDTAHIMIGNRDGVVLYCEPCSYCTIEEIVHFAYSLNGVTTVMGELLNMDWQTETLPFLHSLNVTRVGG